MQSEEAAVDSEVFWLNMTISFTHGEAIRKPTTNYKVGNASTTPGCFQAMLTHFTLSL